MPLITFRRFYKGLLGKVSKVISATSVGMNLNEAGKNVSSVSVDYIGVCPVERAYADDYALFNKQVGLFDSILKNAVSVFKKLFNYLL